MYYTVGNRWNMSTKNIKQLLPSGMKHGMKKGLKKGFYRGKDRGKEEEPRCPDCGCTAGKCTC
jgi:hypothetical protein